MKKINSYLMSGWQQVCAAYRYMASNPRTCMMLLLLVSVIVAFAAVDTKVGQQALTDVSTDLKKYVTPVKNVCYALAGVVAILGSISVYIAMNNEEQDVKKKIMMTVGACIFLLAAAQALPAMFGV